MDKEPNLKQVLVETPWSAILIPLALGIVTAIAAAILTLMV